MMLPLSALSSSSSGPVAGAPSFWYNPVNGSSSNSGGGSVALSGCSLQLDALAYVEAAADGFGGLGAEALLRQLRACKAVMLGRGKVLQVRVCIPLSVVQKNVFLVRIKHFKEISCGDNTGRRVPPGLPGPQRS